MRTPAIAVTGLGMITPVGNDTESTWNGVCAAVSPVRTVPALAGCAIDFACVVDGIDLDAEIGRRTAFRMGRYVKFAVLAAREAVADAGLDPAGWDGSRVAVVVGTSSGGSAHLTDQALVLERRGPEATSPAGVLLTIPNMPAAEIAIEMRATGPSMAPCTACSSGVTALSVARDMLAGGQCDVAIAGATESTVFPIAMTGFARSGAAAHPDGGDLSRLCRPFAADRAGLVMGEGAAVMVLERAADAEARGAEPRALLAGTGATTDAHHPTSPHPDGRIARAAVEAALRDAGWRAGDVEHVNAHGTATVRNDAAEAALIGRMYPHRPPVTAPKGVLGHCMGAAGAIEAGLTVLTLQRGVVPPVANLDAPEPGFDIDCVTKEPLVRPVRRAISHSFGFGGHNAVVALRRP
ncbi:MULTISPECIES: beta-ketoacyl-[acyl-carrier-protein] synthase family protein [unclassified Streptomyces]|uniref:beta-ketoacyl-[acyl-carrier-protein] synthase family protein n=1 Tax=unclassified Streptomyces TaxID=2593676 RepID=UPI000DABC900|nr:MULTISPECIES: beta-ketoacyl-[acyl-carrier-protein] synthase family protein [unclassified Streptomyces]PZT73521.1 3-oxoacyl-ACP synthase [Streptomyces sp. AC1-42T]PZT83486.1 3-oxoacyl-ACP synthase [Streptomyces sp. AC1-42W]